MPNTKNFVFVPGSFHGAWCWFKMQPLLNKNGNTSLAIDLPAHGLDHTQVKEVTLAKYVDAVCAHIEQQTGPVILIGHSRAGIVISEVAERIPNKIQTLVYLCAYLIPDGEPMVATALNDKESALVNGLIFNEQEGWHCPKQEILKEAFYHDCSEEDNWLCSRLISREPNAPVATPLQLSDEKFGKVKKVYIHTMDDRAVTYPHQKKMVERTPVNTVYYLQGSHSPFLSRPGELASILLGI